MGTAIVFLFYGTILLTWAIITLLIEILNKNKQSCKGFLLFYFILTYFLSILCGMTCKSELSWLHYGWNSYGDFIETFLFVFIISNIPSLIMLLIYKNKFKKE